VSHLPKPHNSEPCLCLHQQGPRTEPEPAEALAAALAAGTAESLEVMHHRKDGSAWRDALLLVPLADCAVGDGSCCEGSAGAAGAPQRVRVGACPPLKVPGCMPGRQRTLGPKQQASAGHSAPNATLTATPAMPSRVLQSCGSGPRKKKEKQTKQGHPWPSVARASRSQGRLHAQRRCVGQAWAPPNSRAAVSALSWSVSPCRGPPRPQRDAP
jgi:hypothetical protein